MDFHVITPQGSSILIAQLVDGKVVIPPTTAPPTEPPAAE